MFAHLFLVKEIIGNCFAKSHQVRNLFSTFRLLRLAFKAGPERLLAMHARAECGSAFESLRISQN